MLPCLLLRHYVYRGLRYQMEVLISGIFGVLIGGFIGHRLALGRDKRREYNSAVRPLKQNILEHIDSLNNGGSHLYIKDEYISQVRCWIPEKQFTSIKIAYKKYCDLYRESGKQDDCGGLFYSPEELKKIAKQAAIINSFLHLK